MNRTLIWILLSATVLIGGIWWAVTASDAAPGQYDAFAQCLTDTGVTFYGAWWCPHCQNQKKLFGSSFKNVEYVECSTADGKGQLPVCKDKGVESYPTWEFADGTKTTGELTLQQLADKSECALNGGSGSNVNAANANEGTNGNGSAMSANATP